MKHSGTKKRIIDNGVIRICNLHHTFITTVLFMTLFLVGGHQTRNTNQFECLFYLRNLRDLMEPRLYVTC